MKETNQSNQTKNSTVYKIGSPCILDPDLICTGCKECLMCDLNPEKYCDNCGMCLDSYNTDEKGYVSIKVDKIVKDGEEGDSSVSLEDLLKHYGLDGLDD
ncbi:MAG: hypothetical protein IKC11_05020 [Clostridia bacterium]|nr:hypothetical protein [Clostridia bacterium]